MLRWLIAAACAVVVVALSVIVYSPIHPDHRVAGGPCIFCQFQQLSAEPAATPVQILAPAPVAWCLTPAAPAARSGCAPRIPCGRAPPSPLPAI